MIDQQQDFDLHPASPRTRDAFVALARGIERARANAFVDPLREVAPNERIVRYFPLPYSPLG